MKCAKEFSVIKLDRKTIAKRKRVARAIQTLTPAESAVFELLVEGLSAKDIGKRLGNSPFTISNHTRRIFEAFGTNSRSAIIAMLVVPLDRRSAS